MFEAMHLVVCCFWYVFPKIILYSVSWFFLLADSVFFFCWKTSAFIFHKSTVFPYAVRESVSALSGERLITYQRSHSRTGYISKYFQVTPLHARHPSSTSNTPPQKSAEPLLKPQSFSFLNSPDFHVIYSYFFMPTLSLSKVEFRQANPLLRP